MTESDLPVTSTAELTDASKGAAVLVVCWLVLFAAIVAAACWMGVAR